MRCCGIFKAKDIYLLEPDGCAEKIMESGFCPHCGMWVVAIKKRSFQGNWVYEVAKRKKAQRLFDENKSSIIREFVGSVKFGTRSNMGFRFGQNKEYKGQNNKAYIRQYACDFNGTKELIRQKQI